MGVLLKKMIYLAVSRFKHTGKIAFGQYGNRDDLLLDFRIGSQPSLSYKFDRWEFKQ
jgi:hypothetical protein